MPVGLGVSRLGTQPYGYGTPDGSPDPGGIPLVGPDATRPGSRKIDLVTGQYVFDDKGNSEGMPDMQQMVYLAIKTDLGSSADPTLGQDFTTIKDISANFVSRVQASYRRALSHLTSNNRIDILSIDVQRAGTSGATVHLRWRDLTTGLEDDLRFP